MSYKISVEDRFFLSRQLSLLLFLIGTTITPVFTFSTTMTPTKIALVTGSTDGIGLTTAKALASSGYRVIVHGRDPDRVTKACANVRAAGGSFACAIPALADISTLPGCKSLAETVTTVCLAQSSHLDLLVHNAGVFVERKETVPWDNDASHTLERTFAVNVAAPFAITSLLLPVLIAGSRIIIVSSISQASAINYWEDLQFQKRPYSKYQSYAESKLFDAMLCMEIAERLKVLSITVNCLDPGTVNTKMLLAGWGACGIHVDKALDVAWVSTSSHLEGKSGLYFVGRKATKASWSAYDLNERKKLWEILCPLVSPVSKLWESIM